MAEVNQTVLPQKRQRKVRHRGRMAQVSYLFTKLLRMFVYQSDWKVLPMAALIAALVSMVVRRDFFLTMEGTLKGSFALTCVAMWNGCFNSIQVVCRERGIIKREHRSGMHISSYIFSHMLYQALLCLAQTGLTLYICSLMGVRFPQQGFITPLFVVDLGITIFLISYASDMLCLWLSCLAHTTTTAMTIMPFVLIFQLVFSGGIFNLPSWCQPLSNFTVSNYGIRCIAAQSNYNELPMATAWNTLMKVKDNTIGGTVTVGQVLDLLSDDDNSLVHQLREHPIGGHYTVGQVWERVQQSETWKAILATKVDVNALLNIPQDASATEADEDLSFTIGEALDLLPLNKLLSSVKNIQFGKETTIGEIIDFVASNPDVQKYRDQSFTLKTTVGQLIDLIGEEKAKTVVMQKAAEASRVAAYEHSLTNISKYWLRLAEFILVFAVFAVLSLEPIDRDRR